ncbi:hypothetical protein L484_018463 [Morus notabilis]|uniref:PNPLA domain-containing protein n=1 Tax=Morus notabilis TaxID=981085 RepID=W9SSF2_9ROSA|nr:hypothetical protein L484_018463 [Morus notabilis]
MAALSTLPMLNIDSNYEADKLTYEIFSILENKFLFGYDNHKANHNPKLSTPAQNGKVRILSIDGGGTTGGILAAAALRRLESSLRSKSGNPNAGIADYFDVVAGSGAGGEFPLCNGVEDLIVISLGNGESEFGAGGVTSSPATAGLLRIAGEGASDLVDQAVSMAFKECRTNNLVPHQGNGIIAKNQGGNWENAQVANKKVDILAETENMLAQKNVESVLFQGKKIVGNSNLEKIEIFAGELVKEQERRKTSILPTVALKQMSPSPRTSSATTLSTLSSN